MVKVVAIREHTNAYGSKATKVKGDEYELPEALAKTLSAAGLVEQAMAEPKVEKGK